MIIKKNAVGNKHEAFIESNFTEGLNIISSDDNNKGKTIEIQSMMYALGNEPTFPTTFEYKKYYHYIEFEINNIEYSLCRFNDSFVLKSQNTSMFFENVSELKRYYNKHLFKIPSIIKNDVSRIVDPVLLFQLFFIGQDRNNTSTIAHSGFYNKIDFYNMIFDICNLGGIEKDTQEIETIKTQIADLKTQKSLLLKQYKILKSKDLPVSYLSAANDRENFSNKIENMEILNDKIAELKKLRNTTSTRRAKWETTLKELNSLNRTMEIGELCCMDCKSTNISFCTDKKKSYTFDVSTLEMRKEIIESIEDKIDSYKEEIGKITQNINLAQNDLKEIMKDDTISLESIVAYKQDIFNASDAEERLNEINQQIDNLKNELISTADNTTSKKEQQTQLLDNIITEMKTIYKQIDPTGNLSFDYLFTKKGEVYSGSESTIFYLCKLFAFYMVLKHDFPIIIDSFRAEDLSTTKEKIVIDLYKKLHKQIIFTTTLKNEEIGKYDNYLGINHIDYRHHNPSKMLSAEYVSEFNGLLKKLSIKL